MTVNPQHVQGANALGYLLTEDNRDLKFARELLERAYRAEPLNPYILDSMGWLNFREAAIVQQPNSLPHPSSDFGILK